jgi:hypothetical protein
MESAAALKSDAHWERNEAGCRRVVAPVLHCSVRVRDDRYLDAKGVAS